jgi:hypothetical protein
MWTTPTIVPTTTAAATRCLTCMSASVRAGLSGRYGPNGSFRSTPVSGSPPGVVLTHAVDHRA